MPAFNSDGWIASAIQSIQNQTYQDWELCVVDDGSTDNTVEVVKEFLSDKRIRLLHQQNSGPALARNRAINESKGGLLAFLDSDDLWFSDKLAFQVNYMLGHPEKGLLHTEYRVFHDDPNTSKPFKAPNWFSNWSEVERLLVCDTIGTLTVMTRTELVKQAKGFHSDLHGTEDWDFDTDKPSILRRIFDTVMKSIADENKPVEIQATRGTKQDIMAELSNENKEGDFIPEDIPFLAHKNEIALTEAIAHTYKEHGSPIREIEASTPHRLNELVFEEKKPYVHFTNLVGMSSSSTNSDRATVIQADVNPHFKEKGPLWQDAKGKWYACLAAHAGYSDILKYVDAVKPERVIVDGTRANSETAKSLANSISNELGISAHSKNC